MVFWKSHNKGDTFPLVASDIDLCNRARRGTSLTFQTKLADQKSTNFKYRLNFVHDTSPLLDVFVVIPPLAAAWLFMTLNGLFSTLVLTCCRPSIISSLCASSSNLLDNSDLFLTSPRICPATSGTFSFYFVRQKNDILQSASINFFYSLKLAL